MRRKGGLRAVLFYIQSRRLMIKTKGLAWHCGCQCAKFSLAIGLYRANCNLNCIIAEVVDDSLCVLAAIIGL